MYIVECTMKYRTMNYIFIARTTFSKKVDAMIYAQYYLLSIPVIKTKYYYSLYLAIDSTYYYKITMINETLQNIVILTTNIFAVYGFLNMYQQDRTANPVLRIAALSWDRDFDSPGRFRVLRKKQIQKRVQASWNFFLIHHAYRSVNLEKKCGVLNSSKKQTKHTILSIHIC